MGKAEQTRVQRLPTEHLCSALVAIDRIADQRKALRRKVDPDLMRPTGGKPAFKQCRRGTEQFETTIAGDRMFTAALNKRHSFAVARIAADGAVISPLAGGVPHTTAR